MAKDSALKLCQKFNVMPDKLNYVVFEPHYEMYAFPLRLSILKARQKIQKEVRGNIIFYSREKHNPHSERDLAIMGIKFKKSAHVYIYQSVKSDSEYIFINKTVVEEERPELHLVVAASLPPFNTSFKIHIVKDEVDCITIELYINRFILNESKEALFN